MDVDALACEESERDAVLEQMKYISPRILAQAAVNLANVQMAEKKDAEAIAKASLVTAHHPCIGTQY